MSAEVEFVLDTLASVVTNQTHPLRRVDRDNTLTYLGDNTVANTADSDILETKEGDLTEANYVGVSFVDENTEPIGTEYDHDIERVVGVRIEGLDSDEWGYIDPDGNDGVPFTGSNSLSKAIRDAILDKRSFPSVGAPDVGYHSLRIDNYEADSNSHGDYYRTDFDVVFEGYEDLA
jgi:hypothetical protein